MNGRTKDLVLRVLDSHRIMAIATNRPDGWPQVTTVGYISDGFMLYCFVAANSQKRANILLDARVSAAAHPSSDLVSLLRLEPEIFSLLDYSKGFGHSELPTAISTCTWPTSCTVGTAKRIKQEHGPGVPARSTGRQFVSYQINAMRDQQKAMVWTVVALRNAIRRASRADTTPDFRTIQRLMNYIERVTEQQQQVNEERHLFRLLEKRIPAMTRTMSRLRRDHVAMKGYRMRLAETVNYWRQGDPKSARHAPVVAHDYLDFCERHVRAERDLLPALRKVLSDDEWSGIDRVFASVDDPMARGRSRREREAALETFD